MNNNCLNILKWTEAQLKYTYDVSLQEATPQELHEALGQAVMMAISDDWSHSKKTRMPNRKAYYISAEYLIGRLVYSNLFNLGILDEMKELFAEHGVDLAILEDIEDDALGNGGLGRLAACFLDSAASTDIPLSGYGLRYKFGLFKQSFDADGSQVENADDWTKFGDPWSFRRYNHTVKVNFPDHTVLAVRRSRHRLWHRERGHAAPVAVRGRGGAGLQRLQQSGLPAGFGSQEQGRGHHPRPVPQRLHLGG